MIEAMVREIEIPVVESSGYKAFDFERVPCARTDYLDACIALLTYSRSNRTGTISHLFYNQCFDKYLLWLKENADPENSIAYLVGGTDYIRISKKNRTIKTINSQESVARLRKLLRENNFSIGAEDVLGVKTRNAILFNDGKVIVEWKMRSQDEWNSKRLD
jgi:chemotaxis receptor (MCP) glutamine deamidase CheD